MKIEFGGVAERKVHKFGKVGWHLGWYLDQKLISILIGDWMRRHGPDRVKLVRRNPLTDWSVVVCARFAYAL